MMPDAKKPVRIPPMLIGVGVLVVALGFGLPALISPTVSDAPPRATTEAAEAFAPRPASPAPLTQTPGSIGVGLLRLVLALAVVCALCVLAVRWIGRKPPEPAEPTMRVIASLRVGRCAVHLVRAGDRRILIGTDAAGVKSLVELPGTEPEQPPSAPVELTSEIPPE